MSLKKKKKRRERNIRRHGQGKRLKQEEKNNFFKGRKKGIGIGRKSESEGRRNKT